MVGAAPSRLSRRSQHGVVDRDPRADHDLGVNRFGCRHVGTPPCPIAPDRSRRAWRLRLAAAESLDGLLPITLNPLLPVEAAFDRIATGAVWRG